MKCETIEQYILLEQSGELSDSQKRELDTHVEGCEQCRAFRTDSVLLSELARVPEHETVVSEHTIYRIGQEAQSTIMTQAKPRGHRVFAPRKQEPVFLFWRPILACAAALLLIVAAWGVWSARGPVTQVAQTTIEQAEDLTWENGLDDEIRELDELLVVALMEWPETDADTEWNSDETSELARELLLLEEST